MRYRAVILVAKSNSLRHDFQSKLTSTSDYTSKIGYSVYKGLPEFFHVRCLPPLHIYTSATYLPFRYFYLPYICIGEVKSGQKILNFTLMDTKFYADFRSGLRFGCYQRIFSRYVICLASEATCPLQWDLSSRRTQSDVDRLMVRVVRRQAHPGTRLNEANTLHSQCRCLERARSIEKVVHQ